jgi:hypothetical protein
MNIKSIMSLTLAAAAVACVTVTPAQANNNNAYLNNLAMQMYMQNQANTAAYGAAVNPMLSNPYAYGYGSGPTPWSAGAIPAASPYVYGSSYVVPSVRPVIVHRRWWR